MTPLVTGLCKKLRECLVQNDRILNVTLLCWMTAHRSGLTRDIDNGRLEESENEICPITSPEC